MSITSEPSEWLDKYGDALYRYAMVRLRDSMLAEDMVQETLLAAVQAHGRYAGQSSEKTWLTGILKHKIVDHLRKARRELPLGDDIDTAADRTDELFTRRGHWNIDISQWSDPDKALEQKEFWRIFSECIEHLPPRMGDALMMRELDGLSTEEICQELAVDTTNNLWVILSRARMRMRQCLDAHWFQRQPEDRT